MTRNEFEEKILDLHNDALNLDSFASLLLQQFTGSDELLTGNLSLLYDLTKQLTNKADKLHVYLMQLEER